MKDNELEQIVNDLVEIYKKHKEFVQGKNAFRFALAQEEALKIVFGGNFRLEFYQKNEALHKKEVLE